MQKKLEYLLSPESLQDLQSLYFFLRQNNEEEIFLAIKKKVHISIELLREFPEIGTKTASGIRVFTILKTKYILMFRVKKNILEVVRIFHTSQKWG